MILKLRRKCIALFLVFFYICTPMLDGMVCASCLGNAPFEGKIVVSTVKSACANLIFSKKDNPQSTSAGEQDKTFCSICANTIIGTDIFYYDKYVVVTQFNRPREVPANPILNYSIDKPPQNSLT